MSEKFRIRAEHIDASILFLHFVITTDPDIEDPPTISSRKWVDFCNAKNEYREALGLNHFELKAAFWSLLDYGSLSCNQTVDYGWGIAADIRAKQKAKRALDYYKKTYERKMFTEEEKHRYRLEHKRPYYYVAKGK